MAGRYCGMESEVVVQVQEEAQRFSEEWAEAEWFQVWLSLARREYQGHPETEPELPKAA